MVGYFFSRQPTLTQTTNQPTKKMSSIGMWMPKQKSGKNWMVTFVIETPEGIITREWKHRVREGCQDQIKEYRAIAERNDGFKIVSANISKI